MSLTLVFNNEMFLNEEAPNMTDYNYENMTNYMCEAKEEGGLETFHAVCKPVLYSLIFLLGLLGNGLMITVLLSRRRLLRITEIYLLHLALADLMLLFTLPFNIVENVAGWLFGVFLCKLVGLLKNLNILCGSFLLACISIDRYLAVVHAIQSWQSRRQKKVHMICMILWLISLALSIPNVVFLTVNEPSNTSWLSCYYYNYDIHGHNWVLTNRVLEHVCFFLSLAVMAYCYTAVVVTLFNSQRSQVQKGAIRLALLVTLVFCLCWLPYNIALLINTLVDLEVISYESCESYLLLHPALDVTQSLGFLQCCLNPFLYAFVGVRFRNELLQLLCKLGCSRVCMPFIRAQGHRRPSSSDATTSMSTTYTF